jgi:hypothetical protein
MSTPRPPSFDVAELVREPVATLGLISPAALQGFRPPGLATPRAVSIPVPEVMRPADEVGRLLRDSRNLKNSANLQDTQVVCFPLGIRTRV